MAYRTSLGMGYRHSETNRSLQSASASNILTRLASRAITGHTLPIQVHQHYGTEFHMVLTDDSACIRRCCLTARAALLICTQLERKLEGLCSCMFDPDRVLTLADKVEQCFTARPLPFLFKIPCSNEECDFCKAWKPMERWVSKLKQATRYIQSDVCCCRCRHHEVMS